MAQLDLAARGGTTGELKRLLFEWTPETPRTDPESDRQEDHEARNAYVRFGVMIVTATVVLYGLTYLNTFAIEHVRFSQNRVWMAVLMGAVMALLMLGFMLRMYARPGWNLAVAAGAVVIFALSLWLVRSQASVDDVAYMRAMIPHHSIAVLTSKRAHIRDPRVRELADGIVRAQVREIAEMERLIDDLERHPTPPGARDLLYAPTKTESVR